MSVAAMRAMCVYVVVWQEAAFSDDMLNWIDAMALDDQGYIWFTVNKAPTYLLVRVTRGT